MFALIDCNNFYASCERVFQPRLKETAIIVLSNNDGCVIARSKESKALGIGMGVPYWEVKKLIHKHKVKVFSSNYQLYGDLSERVMEILRSCCDELEVYSIDEAFMKLSFYQQDANSLIRFGEKIRKMILQCLGLPVSVGIAPSKTLAKLANHMAKKENKSGVYLIENADAPILKSIDVSKVWGIGRASKNRLNYHSIESVHDLIGMPEKWMRRHFGVVGLRVLKELKGFPCFDLEPPPSSRKNVVVSRSFRRDVYELSDLIEAISVYASRLGEKLRHDKMNARIITVHLMVNSFRNQRPDGRTYFAKNIELPLASSSTNQLIQAAVQGIKSIYEKGTNYKKAGIMAGELKSTGNLQTNLFESIDFHQQSEKLMPVIDKINKRLGKQSIYFASCGKQQTWKRKAAWCSPAYTTKWSDLLRVK